LRRRSTRRRRDDALLRRTPAPGTSCISPQEAVKIVTVRREGGPSHGGQAKDPWGNERIAFEAAATINRKEFGLNWNAVLETGGFLVGDEVKISLSVQAIRKQG